MQIKCDVLVVGAGPAGLSAAVLLSKKGFSSVILERDKSIGYSETRYDITEGNIISDVLKRLEIKPDKTSEKSEWISPNYSFLLESDIMDFYFKRGKDKSSLENRLFEKIDRGNTEVFLDVREKSYKIDSNGGINRVDVLTHEGKKEILPRYILVADGSKSILRERLKIEPRVFARFRGLGVLVETNDREVIPHAKIYFDRNLAPGGYIYTGSVDKEAFACVVIDEFFTNVNLKGNLKVFLKNQFSRSFMIKNFFGGFGLSGIQNVVSGNVFFIGASALFHDPFLGYGLNYAIESADVAVSAIDKEDKAIYIGYAEKLQKRFEDMKFAREIWRKADNDFFDRLIKSLNVPSSADEYVEEILGLFK